MTSTATGYEDEEEVEEMAKQTEEQIVSESNWRERAAFQRSAFGRSTAGNDVVATIFISLFFSVLRFFLRCYLFS